MTQRHPPPSAPGFTAARSRVAITVAVALLFLSLTAVMTWPLVTRLPTAVADHGDPLLNSWILAWNSERLRGPTDRPWFDANIFYPHPRTLAWSEHLFPQSLIAAPVIWSGGGPVLGYNVVFVLAFATNGLAMYLLARRHTGDDLAAIVAGIVFAFCPFMFGHLWHLQVLCAAGIPLSFLFLERLFHRATWTDAAGFAAVFTAQILANGYYAVFLTLLVPFFVVVELTRRGLWASARLWSRLAVSGAAVALLAAPFFAQYVGMRAETGFVRYPEVVTHWSTLLAVHPLNWLWGPLTSRFGRGEGHLFPGLIALVLAIFGARVALPRSRAPRSDSPLPLGVVSVAPYLAVGGVALLVSFGGWPYQVIRALVPGFDAIRAVSRLHIIVMFVLALLAAYGTAAVAGLRHRLGRKLLRGAIPLALLVEYATIPIPWAEIYGPSQVPAVYRWIEANTGPDDVLLELPLPMGQIERIYAECERVYASTYHWRPLVNGYSGTEPPSYGILIRRWHELPVADNLRDARLLDVRWIVAHTDTADGRELARRLDAVSEGLRPVATFEDATVYALDAAPEPPPPPCALAPLPRDGLSIDASINGSIAARAIDDDPQTRWDSGSQRPDTTVEIALAEPAELGGVRLQFGPAWMDWPRGLRVEATTDGTTWQVLTDDPQWEPPLTAWLDPATAAGVVTFAPTTVRRIRLVQTATVDPWYWSIHDLDLLTCAD